MKKPAANRGRVIAPGHHPRGFDSSAMKFAIDRITSLECAGWAYDPSGATVTVEVWSGQTRYGGQPASLARPDVGAAFHFAANSATCGFHVVFSEDLSQKTEPIELRAVLNGVQHIIYRGHPSDRARTAHQSFEGCVAETDSGAKLVRLGLPLDLSNKTVLDVGCNEGFFCQEAVRRGATRVVGVDIDPVIIEKAKARTPEATFIASSWWQMPLERFDYILCLSAIEYEKNPKRLLSHLANFLSQTGTLILECGVVPDFRSKVFHLSSGESLVPIPTTRMLMEDYLVDFAVRDLGAVEVMQEYETIERCVFHCSRLQPTIVLIHGPSGSGKTSLSREFAKNGVPVVHADAFYSEVYQTSLPTKSSAVMFLRSHFTPDDIEGFIRHASHADMFSAMNELILSAVSLSNSLTVVEGYQFGLPIYADDFLQKAKQAGFRVHICGLGHN